MQQQRSVPEHTFIPKSARIWAIIQLCVVFTLLLSILGDPFLGRLYQKKTTRLLFQEVLLQHPELFSTLPVEEQHEITQAYQQMAELPFNAKAMQSIRLFFVDIPLFLRLWIILGIAIPILLLVKREGALQASWLMPVVTFAYCLNNLFFGIVPQATAEEKLFPSEDYILANYSKEPLKDSLSDQREQLLKGWNHYLIKEWAQQEPSNERFTIQLEEGEFAFSVARLKALLITDEPIGYQYYLKKSPWTLSFYLIWNLFFVIIINHKLRARNDKPHHQATV